MAIMRSLFDGETLESNAPQLGYLSPQPNLTAITLTEKCGVVYTKGWVVDLILDLSGYTSNCELFRQVAIEPSAGSGAFLIPMARRLIESCRRHGHSPLDSISSIIAYEIDEVSAQVAIAGVVSILAESGVSKEEAHILANSWVRVGDYLLDAPSLPRADYVLGNPPYIRLEDMDQQTSSYYRELYSTMSGRADIYIAFYEAALRQLKSKGVCAFICADRWMLNQYGADLRKLVTSGFSVEAVIEMHDADAFDSDVSAYPAITLIRRSDQGPVIVASASAAAADRTGHEIVASMSELRTSNGADVIAESGIKAARLVTWFKGADPWPCIAPEKLALLKRLERDFNPIENNLTRTMVGIGVATGADKVFITKDPALVEGSRLLPLAMAKDASEGRVNWSGHYLIDPWEVSALADLHQYPRLSEYFQRHVSALTGRNVSQKSPTTWYRTIDRVNHWLLERPKLYIADIKNKLVPCLDDGRTYPHHNLYFIHSYDWNTEVLGGLLLSPLAQFFVESYCVRMRGGYLRFQAQYLRRIRVPKPKEISDKNQELLIDAFRRFDVHQAAEVTFEIYDINDNARSLFGY